MTGAMVPETTAFCGFDSQFGPDAIFLSDVDAITMTAEEARDFAAVAHWAGDHLDPDELVSSRKPRLFYQVVAGQPFRRQLGGLEEAEPFLRLGARLVAHLQQQRPRLCPTHPRLSAEPRADQKSDDECRQSEEPLFETLHSRRNRATKEREDRLSF